MAIRLALRPSSVLTPWHGSVVRFSVTCSGDSACWHPLRHQEPPPPHGTTKARTTRGATCGAEGRWPSTHHVRGSSRFVPRSPACPPAGHPPPPLLRACPPTATVATCSASPWPPWTHQTGHTSWQRWRGGTCRCRVGCRSLRSASGALLAIAVPPPAATTANPDAPACPSSVRRPCRSTLAHVVGPPPCEQASTRRPHRHRLQRCQSWLSHRGRSTLPGDWRAPWLPRLTSRPTVRRLRRLVVLQAAGRRACG